MTNDPKRVALFGGSFDPPHLGHVLCATFAHAVAAVDEVWVLPVAEHPFGKPLTPWEQRWRLCAAAFAGLSFVRLCDDERRNPGGRTITLLESLRQQHPGWTWYLIGGTDTHRDLPTWYRGSELAAMVEVIAVPRRGYDDQDPRALPAISSTTVRTSIASGAPWRDLVPGRVAQLIDAEGLYLNPA